MKMFLVILFACFSAVAAEPLRLQLPREDIRLGSLVDGKLIVEPSSANLPLQKLKGMSVSETLYVQKVSPLLKTEGSGTYVSDIQVIFIKIPEGNSLPGKIGNDDFILSWNPVRILPLETPEQMLWAEFSVPEFFEKNWTWLLFGLILLPLIYGAYVLVRKYQQKKKVKERRRKLVQEFTGCQSYEDIVTLWKGKHSFLKEFPQIEGDFRKFEEILFRYQFKPSQTEAEKSEVINAYRRMIADSQGGLSGV